MTAHKSLVSIFALIALFLAACQAQATPPPSVTQTVVSPTAVPTAIPPTSAPTTVPPTAPPAQVKRFTSPKNASFQLPLTLTYGPEWDTEVGINTIGIIHKGSPPQPDSQWWGPAIILLNGALVHDPANAVSNQPANPDKSRFIPLPDDFFSYLTALPGVKAISAEPVTIAGIQGKQVIVHTPPMHPILWLKDDYNWLGGGKAGVDPELMRQFILLPVNGEQVLLEFDESPAKFDERFPLVQELFKNMTFGK